MVDEQEFTDLLFTDLLCTDLLMQALRLRGTEITEALAPERLEAGREEVHLPPLRTWFDEAAPAELIASGAMRSDQLNALPAQGVLWMPGLSASRAGA